MLLYSDREEESNYAKKNLPFTGEKLMKLSLKSLILCLSVFQSRKMWLFSRLGKSDNRLLLSCITRNAGSNDFGA